MYCQHTKSNLDESQFPYNGLSAGMGTGFLRSGIIELRRVSIKLYPRHSIYKQQHIGTILTWQHLALTLFEQQIVAENRN